VAGPPVAPSSVVTPGVAAVSELATVLNAMREAHAPVAVPSPERVDVPSPLYDFRARQGWQPEREAIRTGSWPVSFIPLFSPLTQEALELAERRRGSVKQLRRRASAAA
jgi:hypothetical protein